jgi:hypothetical protein
LFEHRKGRMMLTRNVLRYLMLVLGIYLMLVLSVLGAASAAGAVTGQEFVSLPLAGITENRAGAVLVDPAADAESSAPEAIRIESPEGQAAMDLSPGGFTSLALEPDLIVLLGIGLLLLGKLARGRLG